VGAVHFLAGAAEVVDTPLNHTASCQKFRCCEKMSKFPLGQLQFYIFAEIVFGVRCTLNISLPLYISSWSALKISHV